MHIKPVKPVLVPLRYIEAPFTQRPPQLSYWVYVHFVNQSKGLNPIHVSAVTVLVSTHQVREFFSLYNWSNLEQVVK